MRKIDRVKKRFVEEGLDAALDKTAMILRQGSCPKHEKPGGP
jgi:hypothetical protein